MNKMISKSANIYSQSLIDSAVDNDLILKTFGEIQEVFKSSADLKNVLENPVISIDAKLAVLTEVFKGKIDNHIFEFLKILTEKSRINLFDEIFESFQLKIEDLKNIKRFEIVSAIALGDELKSQIVSKLSEKFNKEIVSNWIVDEDIIGGLIIKYDDNVIDSSLRNRLTGLSKTIK